LIKIDLSLKDGFKVFRNLLSHAVMKMGPLIKKKYTLNLYNLTQKSVQS